MIPLELTPFLPPLSQRLGIEGLHKSDKMSEELVSIVGTHEVPAWVSSHPFIEESWTWLMRYFLGLLGNSGNRL